AAAKKKKGLTAKSVSRAYMLYVCGSFLFPTKKGTDVSARYLDLFVKDKVAKKWSWGSAVLAHMYYNLGAASRDNGKQVACCTTLLEVNPYSFLPGSLHISQNLLGSPRRWTPTHMSTALVRNGTHSLRIDTLLQLCSCLGRHWTSTN
ncbi:hypothetical protein GIB67_000522, partial [Kingdonia uniflora]